MYTTINSQHNDYVNLIKFENSKEFVKTFKNHKDIILVFSNREYKYKKFKDYYIRYYYCDNYLKNIEYFNYSGELHREDGPACLEYYENGKVLFKGYYLNGKRHREDRPACLEYYLNGKIKYKSYYLNGKKHREEGTARIWYNKGEIKDKEYYLNDEEYSYEDYLEELKCLRQYIDKIKILKI